MHWELLNAMKKRRICGVCDAKYVEMCETNLSYISCHVPANVGISIVFGVYGLSQSCQKHRAKFVTL